MKKILLLLVVAAGFLFGLSSCEENDPPVYRVVLSPDASSGKDVSILSTNLEVGPDVPYMSAFAQSMMAQPANSRILLEFNLDIIPSYAHVLNATLSLYADSTVYESHINEYGSNACWVQRVTSGWDPYSVNWDNQPATTEEYQVELPTTTSDTESFPSIDVTDMVQQMISGADGNHGFMIRLQDETPYRRMTFASSENSNETIRPRLVISFEQ